MNSKIKLAIIIFSLFLNGCATARKEHFQKKFLKLSENYGGKIISTKKMADTSSYLPNKTKKLLALIEQDMALTPDTIRIHVNAVLEEDSQKVISRTIDSIFTNKYKIRYIKKHKLKSPNMHFSLIPDTISSSEDKHVHVADSTKAKILDSLLWLNKFLFSLNPMSILSG